MEKREFITTTSKASTCTKVSPVIKWAGGKTQLLEDIRRRMPKHYNRYYEPFLGGAAVYLAIQPERSTLNDVNPQLINVYRQIQTAPDELIHKLQAIQKKYNGLPDQEQKDCFYYDIRDSFNRYKRNSDMSVRAAALFIFLNKTCFNGLYRENRKGSFNVPSGHKSSIHVCNPENIHQVSRLLQKAILLNGDFEAACETADAGDFAFFDSPYFNTFDAYQAGGFTETDHRRLAALVESLTEKGVKCMLTNSDTEFIRNLYTSCHIETVPVRRNICRDGRKRTDTEIIITNY